MEKKYFIEMDKKDPLKEFRNHFFLPKNTIYFDGNSLGMAPKITKKRMEHVIGKEWGQGLIRSWADEEWGISGQRIGNKISKLIGANDGEVIAADSTSINIYKALTAAIQCNKNRNIILSTNDNFPTDLYMMQGLQSFSPNEVKNKIVNKDEIDKYLDERVAALLLTEVDYKTGEILNMNEITKKAHDKGILVIWDLSHSVGSIPVDLNKCAADFAVGCGYKFLNGGPGAPAFLFVAKKHQEKIRPILSGWMGHKNPFDFSIEYKPADGIDRFLCGTPPLLGLIALECGVDLILKAKVSRLRKKAVKLSSLFIELMESMCSEFDFKLASPRDDNRRAGHVSFIHHSGFAVSRAIASKGIVGDFRAPNIVRFGIAPMYTRFQDIFDAVNVIRETMQSGLWKNHENDISPYT